MSTAAAFAPGSDGSMAPMADPGTVTLRWTVPVEIVVTVPDNEDAIASAEERVRELLDTFGGRERDIRVFPDIDLPEPVEERP